VVVPPNPPNAGVAVDPAPNPPNPPVDAAVEAGVLNEKGVAAAAGAVDVVAPNENPEVCAAGVVPNAPKGAAAVAAGAPNPPIEVVVNPGVVSEKAGAAEAVALG